MSRHARRRSLSLLVPACALLVLGGCSAVSPEHSVAHAAGPARETDAATLRIATFNTSLYDPEGQLVSRLERGDPAAANVAAILQHVRPDVVLLNEFDYDPEGAAARLFRERYLQRGQAGEAPIEYPYAFAPPVNTGVPSGFASTEASHGPKMAPRVPPTEINDIPIWGVVFEGTPSQIKS